MDIFSHGIVFKIEPKFVCKRPKMNEKEAGMAHLNQQYNFYNRSMRKMSI